MASNVLKGDIKIVAPGAAATFNGVAEGAKKTQAAIVKLNPGVSKLGENLETLRAKALVRQSLINTETDVRKIAEMNRELKVLQGEIARVESIGTSGFGAAGKAATGFLGHLRNIAYVLPGIGIAGLLGGLSEMVIGLFKGADAFSEIEIEAGKFDNAMKKLSDRLENFKSSLDFSEKLKNLSLELSGLSGSALAAGKSGNAFLTNIKYASELGKEIDDLSKKREAFFNQRLESEKQIQAVFGKSTKLADAFAIFGSVEDIPEGIAEKLSNADKEFVREYKAATEKIKVLSKERNEAIQSSVLNVGDIFKSGLDEQKRINDLSKQEYDAYVNGIISKAKKYDSALKDIITISPSFRFDDTKNQEFIKSLKYLNDYAAKNFKFKIPPPEIDMNGPEAQKVEKDIRSDAQRFAQMFSEEFNENVKIDFSLPNADQDKQYTKLLNSFSNLGKIGQKAFANIDFSNFDRGISQAIKKLQELEFIQRSLAEVLTPAFDALFGAIQKGENVIAAFGKAFGDAIVSMVKKLASLAAVSGILSLLGFGSFGSIFRGLLGFGGGKASGGPVSGGTSYLVGEDGPEIFRPNTGGYIVPNNQLGGGATIAGGISVSGVVTNILRGKDLVQLIALQTQSNNRLIG